MGSPVVLVAGKRISIPGVYPEVDASGMAPTAVGGARVPLVIAPSEGGVYGKVYTFRSFLEAQSVVRGGRVLSYLGRMFNPGPGIPGASVVLFIRSTSDAAPASINLVYVGV